MVGFVSGEGRSKFGRGGAAYIERAANINEEKEI